MPYHEDDHKGSKAHLVALVWAVFLTCAWCASFAAPLLSGREKVAPAPQLTVPVVPVGFTSGQLAVTQPDSGVAFSVWVAKTSEERQRGLSNVTALGERDAMAFVFEADTMSSFTMRDTTIALDIVFVDADGAVVSTSQMEPCEAEPCPSFEPAGPFRMAVEFPSGTVSGLALTPSSRFSLSF